MYPACSRIVVAVSLKVWFGNVRLSWSTMAALGSQGELAEGLFIIELMRKIETEIVAIRMAVATIRPTRSRFFFLRTLCFIPRVFRLFLLTCI